MGLSGTVRPKRPFSSNGLRTWFLNLVRSDLPINSINYVIALSSRHLRRISTWFPLSANLVPTWGLDLSADGFEGESRLAPDGSDEPIDQREFRFSQSRLAAELDHVTLVGAHAFDVFGQVERFGQKRVAWNRSMRVPQFLQRQRGRQGTGILR